MIEIQMISPSKLTSVNHTQPAEETVSLQYQIGQAVIIVGFHKNLDAQLGSGNQI